MDRNNRSIHCTPTIKNTTYIGVMKAYRFNYLIPITIHCMFLFSFICNIHSLYSFYYIFTTRAHINTNHSHYNSRSYTPSPRSQANTSFTINCIHILLICVLVSWLYVLLLHSGDVHPNPGPSSVSSDTSLTSSSVSFRSNTHLSFVHYNVQSIFNKIDVLSAELIEYDILAFTETWLNESINDISPKPIVIT